MSGENIDIRIREDGSRVVSRNLDAIAAKADAAQKSVNGMNKTLGDSKNSGVSLERLKQNLKETDAFSSQMVQRFGANLNQYRNSLMKHFEMISKDARATSSSIKSQMEAITAITPQSSAMSAYYKGLQESEKAYRTRSSAAMVAHYESVSNQAKATSSRMKSYMEAMTTLPSQRNGGMSDLVNHYKNLEREASAAHVPVKNLSAEHIRLADTLGRSGNAMSFWNNSAKEAHSLTRGLAGSLNTLWLTYGSLIPLLAGAALGSTFVAAAKAGSEFAYQLEFVRLLGKESADSVAQLGNQAKELAQTGPYGAVEIAKGYRMLAQSGLDAAQQLKVMPDVLNLATVGEMKMEQAANSLVGILNAFSLPIEKSAHVTDVFAKAAAVSQTSVQQMTESMKTASVVGEQYKVSVEDTATALMLLAKNNITGSAAGTAFRNMVKELYAPSEQSAKAMKLLGLSAADSTGKLRPMADVIYELRETLSGYNEISQAQILKLLFGERGDKEAIAMLRLTKEEWIKLRDEIANSDGFTKGIANELNNTAKMEWKKALNTLEVTFIEAFQNMEPYFKSLAQQLGELFADPGFKNGVQNVISSFLTIAQTTMDLLPLILDLAKAWLVLKAATLSYALVQGAASGFAALQAAVTGGTLAMQTFRAVSAGTATTLTGGTGVIAALGGVAGPLGIVLGLLAAGAAAWVLWGDSSREAMNKAASAAQAASSQIQNMLEQQQAGFKINSQSWQLGLNKATKAQQDVAKQIQGQLDGSNSNLNLPDSMKYRFDNGKVFQGDQDKTAEFEKGNGWTSKVKTLLTSYNSLTGEISTANDNLKMAISAEESSKKTLEEKKNTGIPSGTKTFEMHKGRVSGRLSGDDNALANLKAKLDAAREEYAIALKAGDTKFKLNEGDKAALKIQEKIVALKNKSTTGLDDKGMTQRTEQLASLNQQLDVAQNLGDQLRRNATLGIEEQLTQELKLAIMMPEQRDKENRYLQIKNQFLAHGITLSEGQEAKYRAHADQLQKINKIMEHKAQIDNMVRQMPGGKDYSYEVERAKQYQSALMNLWSSTVTPLQEVESKLNAINDAFKNGAISQEMYTQKLATLNIESAKLLNQIGGTNGTTFMLQSMDKIMQGFVNLSYNTADLVGTAFESVVDGMGNAISRAIVYGESFSDAMRSVAQQVLSQLISSLIKLGVQFLINQAIGEASLATMVAAQSASAATMAAAWAPAAAMASLASFGANSAPAMIGIESTVALAEGLALIPAFATGGSFTVGGSGGVDSQLVAMRASPGEKVTVATPTQVRHGDETNSGSGGGSNSSSSNPVKIVNVLDPAIVGDYLRTDAGEQLVVNIVQRNKGSLG